jgi:prevent-host-death family protein
MRGKAAMATLVNVNEAKAHLSNLLERVRKGEEFVLAKAGKPCARLVPLEEKRPRQPGIVEGSIDDLFIESLPEDELKAWEA